MAREKDGYRDALERIRIGAVFVLLHQLERAVYLMQCACVQVA